MATSRSMSWQSSSVAGCGRRTVCESEVWYVADADCAAVCFVVAGVMTLDGWLVVVDDDWFIVWCGLIVMFNKLQWWFRTSGCIVNHHEEKEALNGSELPCSSHVQTLPSPTLVDDSDVWESPWTRNLVSRSLYTALIMKTLLDVFESGRFSTKGKLNKEDLYANPYKPMLRKVFQKQRQFPNTNQLK